MQENKPKGPSAGPPLTFSMPMYREWVPQWLRPWLYVLLACCFQLSNGMYLGAMATVVGERGVMREDVQMCLYATLIGMALWFPVLFRMKFRFTNKTLLTAAAAVVAVCNLLASLPLPLPLLWALCVVCGVAKIQGTFECMSVIQLWMTPKRDFAVFFPLLHVILLSSIELAAYLSAWFAYAAHWTHMHWLTVSLMLFALCVLAALTRPVRAMPKVVSLRGIDWMGAVLWAALCLQTAYLLNYGDWLDWWNSRDFRLVCGTSLVTLAFCLRRMCSHPKPYYEPAMWGYRNVMPVIALIGVVEALFSCEHVLEGVYYGSVMHYAEHTSEALNLWSLPGIVAGCLFSIGWLKLMRWNVYKLIAFALGFFALYAGGFYFLMDTGLSIEMLRLPIVCRGFSYALLCVAFMWCLHEIMSFEHFFQALSVFNVLHMFVGGLVGAALHAYGMKYYVADGFARLSQYVDAARLSASPERLGEVAQRLSAGLVAQSVKTLFGWTLLFALFFAMLMLLWDIPMVRRQVKHVPLWPKVGMGVWRSYRRQRRLHRLRRLRRA